MLYYENCVTKALAYLLTGIFKLVIFFCIIVLSVFGINLSDSQGIIYILVNSYKVGKSFTMIDDPAKFDLKSVKLSIQKSILDCSIRGLSHSTKW